MIAVRKEIAKRKVSFALCHPRKAEAQKQEEELRKLPAGSPVMVYRPKSKKWEGPFPMVSIDDGIVVVQMPRGRKLFRSSLVKSVSTPDPVMPEFTDNDLPSDNKGEEADIDTTLCATTFDNQLQPSPQTLSTSSVVETSSNQIPLSSNQYAAPHPPIDPNLCPTSNLPTPSDSTPAPPLTPFVVNSDETNHAFISTPDPQSTTTVQPDPTAMMTEPTTTNQEEEFKASRKKELVGFMAREVFEIVKRSSLPSGTRIFGSRWIDTYKTVNGRRVAKSRLVSHYNDSGAAEISTNSPTICRASHRTILATAAQSKEHTLYTRDITQAYVQSESKLERDIYLEPLLEMMLGKEFVLLVVKPLYGVPESGVHWFNTYQGLHLSRLDMKANRYDPCLLYSREGLNLHALTGLQVDDNLGHADDAFLRSAEEQSRIFESKPRKLITTSTDATFNGVHISSLPHHIYAMDQRSKILELQEPHTVEAAVSVCASLQYTASCVRPDLVAPSQLLAGEVLNPTPDKFKKLRSIVRWVHDTSEVLLKFVTLHDPSLRLFLLTDASFAVTSSHKSQMAFFLV